MKVLRDGKIQEIDSKDIVMGDIILLGEGDKVSADGILLECQGLGMNESILTGESEVVYKKYKKIMKIILSGICVMLVQM